MIEHLVSSKYNGKMSAGDHYNIAYTCDDLCRIIRDYFQSFGRIFRRSGVDASIMSQPVLWI